MEEMLWEVSTLLKVKTPTNLAAATLLKKVLLSLYRFILK
jgi:hypothetical protein